VISTQVVVGARFSVKGSVFTHGRRSRGVLGCLWSLLLTGSGSEVVAIFTGRSSECWTVWTTEAGLPVLPAPAGAHERTKAPLAAACTARTDTEIHGERNGEIEEMLLTRGSLTLVTVDFVTFGHLSGFNSLAHMNPRLAS
jgi:hypothetical protein